MKLVFRLARLILGIFIVSFGIILTIKADLGLSPWDIFHDGLSKSTPLSFGTAGACVGIVLLVFLLFAKEKIGVGTIINTVFVGVFIDLLLWIDIIPASKGLLDGLAVLTAGIFLFSFGTFLYIGSQMGSGPRDGLMVYFVKRSRLPVSVCRIIIEGTVTVFGFVLGGKLGLGTVFAALLTGPAMQLIFSMLKFDVATLKHESVYDTMFAVRKKDELL